MHDNVIRGYTQRSGGYKWANVWMKSTTDFKHSLVIRSPCSGRGACFGITQESILGRGTSSYMRNFWSSTIRECYFPSRAHNSDRFFCVTTCSSSVSRNVLVRYPPFYDENPIGIYQKILAGRLDVPRHVDTKAKDIIKRLLTTDRTNRLGETAVLRSLCTRITDRA